MNALFVMAVAFCSLVPIGATAQEAPSKEGSSRGQSLTSADLRAEISRADSALFDAFNARDLQRIGTFFTPDLEFYLDNEGLGSYAQTMKDFGLMFAQPAKLHREFVPGSLEVYPIKGFGAVEIGSHRFCHVENGKEECGTFKFVHVWKKTNDQWQIARVVSYAH